MVLTPQVMVMTQRDEEILSAPDDLRKSIFNLPIAALGGPMRRRAACWTG